MPLSLMSCPALSDSAGGAYLADLVGDVAVVLPAAVDVGDIGAAGLQGVEDDVAPGLDRRAGGDGGAAGTWVLV